MPRGNVTATLGEYADNLAKYTDVIGDGAEAYVTVGEVKALVKFVRAIEAAAERDYGSWDDPYHILNGDINMALTDLEGSVHV